MLAASSSITGLPVACGALVGGYTLIQLSLQTLLEHPRLWLVKRRCRIGAYQQNTLSRFTAAFTASWLTLLLLNIPDRQIDPNKETLSNPTSNQQNKINLDEAESIPTIKPVKRPPLLGETLDLTLLVSIRALDTVIAELWSRHKASRISKAKWTSFESFISLFSDTGAFVLGCSLIMWAWFYLPERLPRTYNEWIGEAAQVDSRLIETLRKARFGEFVYGLDDGQAGPLQSMCEDYDWPVAWGDPAQTIPIPCEVVHMGTGPSCHQHAIIRFFRAFKFALIMYLPIQLLAKARTPSMKSLKQAVQNALRSSAFLGAFISLFYYSVCLSRTILGPKIFRRELITPMMWDSGLCVKAGCIMCGWSILIETPKRRQEFSLFVAPRALATLLPRKYPSKVSTIRIINIICLTNDLVFLERTIGILYEYCGIVYSFSRKP